MKHLIIVLIIAFLGCPIEMTLNAKEPSPVSQSSSLGYRIVKKDNVPACYTLEAWDLLGEFSNENNTQGIDMMILSGMIEILKKGEKVELLHCNFSYAKIKRANGKVMYTSIDWLDRD